MFSSGIEQSSKIKLLVDEPRMPSLSSFLPNENPKNKFQFIIPYIPKSF